MATVSPPDPPAVSLAPQQAAALQRALHYVDAHLSQPLRVTELAAVACVSRFHLVRLFRIGTGASPLRYVRRRRIERARQLLPGAQLPMACLAQQLGFFDQSHFVRSFRAETGCSPGQFLAGDAALLLPADLVSPRSPSMSLATATPAPALLSPADHALVLIDFQSQMAFATHTIDISALRNNVSLISKGAKGFNVPVVLTTVAETSFSGPMFPELPQIFPGQTVFDRTSMNTWEDPSVIDEINRIGKRRLVIAGLWTSVCIVGPALSALAQGFEVYVITDACGDVSEEAHERAITRMVQAGAVPMTSVQYLLELQRDWARGETYDLTTGIARDHAGGYGIGIQYAKSMFGAQEGGH